MFCPIIVLVLICLFALLIYPFLRASYEVIQFITMSPPREYMGRERLTLIKELQDAPLAVIIIFKNYTVFRYKEFYRTLIERITGKQESI